MPSKLILPPMIMKLNVFSANNLDKVQSKAAIVSHFNQIVDILLSHPNLTMLA